MSTLGGIYDFQKTAIDPGLMAALSKGLAGRGPDGGSEAIQGSLSMVYRAFHTNKESHRENQPFVSSEGHIICWDGRLDNRDELVSALNDKVDGRFTDVAIVLASYEKWGIEFLSELVGDFALSLWDAHTRVLLLARDPVGPRSLFYRINGDAIIWSSLILPLLDLTDVRPEVDDEFIAVYLTRDYDPQLTPYKEIRAVPPGHFLIFKNGRIRIERFWKFDPNFRISYRTDAEYQEHFRHLFREAVRCRMRVDGPVWAQLSGGLDSSSIVCMANQLINNNVTSATRLQTISYVYDESRNSDERKFISCVEEKIGHTGYHLSDTDYPPLASFSDEYFTSFPDFLDCFSDRYRKLCEAMLADGARVLLTGHGGDEVLCSAIDPAPELSTLLFQRDLVHLHQSLKRWSTALNRSYFNLLWQEAVLRLLPRGVQVRFVNRPGFKLPPWFDKDFAARLDLHKRNLGPVDLLGARLPSNCEQVSSFFSAAKSICTGAYRERGLVETSHPFLHQPLVEFLQSIPFEQKVRPGEPRLLLRGALRDLLPDRIINRKSKRGPEEAFFRAVRREWPLLKSLFAKPLVCERGYMDVKSLATALERARHGCEKYSFALIKTISLEFWLRALERRNATTESAAVLVKPIPQITAVRSPAAPRKPVLSVPLVAPVHSDLS